MATIKELAIACYNDKWGNDISMSDEILGDCAFCVDAKELMVADGKTPNTTFDDYCAYCQLPQTLRDLYKDIRDARSSLSEVDFNTHVQTAKDSLLKLNKDGAL